MGDTSAIRRSLDRQAEELRVKRDDFLQQGLLGSHRDIKRMMEQIEETRLKLNKIDCPQCGPCDKSAEAMEEFEEISVVDWPSSPLLQPLEYRWDVIGRKARLSVGVALGELVSFDLSENRIRLACGCGCLNLPLPFHIDVCSQRPAVRRKHSLQVILVASARAYADIEILARDIETQTWGLLENCLSPELVDSLRVDVLNLLECGRLIPGEIHSGIKEAVRSDLHEFVNPRDLPSLARVTREVDLLVSGLYERIPALSSAYLRRLHPMVAVYPKGARYTAHFDAFQGDTSRVLTVIVYLNPTWMSAVGGELRLYPGRDTDKSIDVEPLHGRLLAFLCDTMNLHEVLECHAPRVAATFWYEHKK